MTRVLEEGSLQYEVWNELKQVRQRGLDRLDAPKLKPVHTPLLEAAATKMSGYRLNLTRAEAIKLLLNHEIDLMEASPYQEWLPVSFGLSVKPNDSNDPTVLRKKAAEIAGDNNPTNFGRTGGKEQEGLAALAAQIEADCLKGYQYQSQEAGTSELHPVPSNLFHRITATHRRKKQLGAATLAVLIIVAAVIFWPSDEPPITNPLITTVTSIDSTADYYSAIFPRDSGKSQDFLRTIQGKTQLDLERLLFEEIEAGGYSHGGIRVHLTVEGNTDREVTITNIRPAIAERQQAITGEVIVGPSVGTGPAPERMGFILDRVSPDARVVNEDGSYGSAYFDTYGVGLPNRSKQSLILEFSAQASAFTFDIQIDYEVGGQQFQQIVQKDGKPLRLRTSASLCHQSRQANKVPEEDRKFLDGLNYSGVTFVTTDEKGTSLQRVDPAEYQASCFR